MEKPSLLGLSRVATNEDAINRDNGNNYCCANMQVFDDLFGGMKCKPPIQRKVG